MLLDLLKENDPTFHTKYENLTKLKGYFDAEPGPTHYNYLRWTEVGGLVHQTQQGQNSIIERYNRGQTLTNAENRALEISTFSIVYETARTHGLLHNYRWTSKQIVSELADALFFAIDAGQLVNMFSAARSIIEKTANLHLALLNLNKAIKDVGTSNNHYMNLVNLLSDSGTVIGDSGKQSRIGWKHLESGESIRQKKTKKPETLEGNQEYESINTLKGVDKLDKEIFGLRSTYDFLCEFVHPNFGHSFVHIRQDGVKEIRHGLIYRMRTSEKNMATESWRALSPTITEVIEVLVELLEKTKQIDQRFIALEKLLRSESQKYVKTVIKKQPLLFGQNDYCPCGSGKFISKCCGRKLRGNLLADNW